MKLFHNYKLIYICENDLSIPIGGTVHVNEILKSLNKFHPDVLAVVPMYSEKPLLISPEVSKIIIKTPNRRVINWLYFYLASVIMIIRSYFSNPRLVVYSREMPLNIFFLFCIKIMKIPLILEINSSIKTELDSLNKKSFEKIITSAIQRFIIRFADRVVSVSETLKNDLVKTARVNPACINVIYNGIPADIAGQNADSANIFKYFNIHNPFIIGFIGSCYPYHDIDSLISVTPQILKRFPDTRFFIGGDGPVLTKWKRIIKTMQLEHYFHFHGYVNPEQVPGIIQAFHCCVSIYKHDVKGPGMKIFDYLIQNKAVIVSSQWESRKLFRDFKNIIWTEIENPSSILSAYTEVRNKYDVYNKFDSRSMILKKFTWDHTAKKIFDTIHETICAA